MKSLFAALALFSLSPAPASAVTSVTRFPLPSGAPNAPLSRAVQAGDTLYVSGFTDMDPATGRAPTDIKAGTRLVMNNVKAAVEAAGYTMDDLVWVQVFSTDLTYFAEFNEVYRSYFKGPPPARAWMGAGGLLGNSHFEVMGIAVKAE